MDPALAPGTVAKPAVFQDGLGDRRRTSDVSGADTIEMLCLRSELTAIPSFEFALRERASRLANFRHTYYARVRSVDRLNDPAATLTVVSDSVKGVRLSNLLAASERRPMALDINASLHLIRQLVSAVAMLHENARDVAHGALGPERIIVTPNARVVIVEYVLGAALEQLHFSHERYWKELRVALPPSAGLPHFDHRSDVTQIGVVALSLILGRLLHDDEYPARIGDVLASATAITSKGDREPLPASLRTWIGKALQLDHRTAFPTALAAREELDRVLSGETEPSATVAPASAAQDRQPSAVTSAQAGGTHTPPVKTDASERIDKIEKKPAAAEIRLPEFSSSSVAATPSPAVASRHEITSLQDFQSEPERELDDETDSEDASGFRLPAGLLAGRARIAAAIGTILVVSTVGVYGGRRYFAPAAAAPTTGTLSVNSNPPGAEVLIDGQTRGVTPVNLALKPGSHVLELRNGSDPRTIPVTIVAGTQVSQYLELPKVTAFGQLQIKTEPAGARVTVDGIPRGKSPVLVESLAAGDHAVVLENDLANLKQTVTVEAGITASLVVPMAAAAESAPVSGWISVSAPVELQILENKRQIGTTQNDRVMLSAGKHEIEMVNDALGYRASRTVQVVAGKVAAIKPEWPKGTIAINALPWAEVWIDGERIGETPIGNLSLPIGGHEIVFRHPDLGEQNYAATVSLKAPTRVSVDLRKK